MPTYELRCKSCGHTFERFQKMTDEPALECPRCGKQAERLLSGGAGVLFKGEGFYATDYRSESYRKAAEREKGAAGKKEGGGGEGAGTGDTGSGGSEGSGSDKKDAE